MYDNKGHPLPPGLEFQQIVQYFIELFTDPDFVPPPRPALEVVPFTMDEVIDGLNRLPMTKVLALDGLPAIVWKTLASEFGPLAYHSIVDIYIYRILMIVLPRSIGQLDGYTC